MSQSLTSSLIDHDRRRRSRRTPGNVRPGARTRSRPPPRRPRAAISRSPRSLIPDSAIARSTSIAAATPALSSAAPSPYIVSPSIRGTSASSGQPSNPTVSVCAFRQSVGPPPVPRSRASRLRPARLDLHDLDLGPGPGQPVRARYRASGALARPGRESARG